MAERSAALTSEATSGVAGAISGGIHQHTPASHTILYTPTPKGRVHTPSAHPPAQETERQGPYQKTRRRTAR